MTQGCTVPRCECAEYSPPPSLRDKSEAKAEADSDE